ncbi:MAG: CDP-glucose 4,6-dehydratase [Pirellulaceae bacterium]|nr:CDP-glucose 4,6-dehydratase [Pirellulaceae bacterium]
MGISLEHCFRHRTVLVTGHTGFKGSWLCLWLQRLGARLTGYALDPPTQPNHFTLASVGRGMIQDCRADLNDLDALQDLLDGTRPEVILHLAAQSTVGESHRAPRETFATNVLGTVNLLEAVRRLNRPCVVVLISSDKCYENREQVWGYRETDALGGRDPYSASKAALELVAAAYRDSFFPPRDVARHGVKLATARAGNVLGGGDWTREALLVDAVDALRHGRPVRLRHPRAVRPWQHVLEPLSGYLHLAARLLVDDDPRLCGGWNFGPSPGQELPVWQLVEQFARLWGGGQWEPAEDAASFGEAGQLRLCIDKAIWQLDWRPRWSLPQALARTADWYREYYASGGGAMRICSEQQIADYERTLSGESEAHDPRLR